MKKLTQIIVMMVISIITIKAQNTDFIDVKKGKDLKDIKIHEINTMQIVYEENGSLHDLINKNVNYLVKDSISYSFNENGELIPQKVEVIKYLIGSETKISIDTTKITSNTNEVSKAVIDTNSIDTINDRNNVSSIDILKLKELYDEGLIDKEEFLLIKKNTLEKDITENKELNTKIEKREEEKSLSNYDLYDLGYQDAIKYYNGSEVAAIGYISGFVPVAGLIPTAIISSIPTSNRVNLKNPNIDHFKNISYKEGYKKSASKIKKRNVWRGFWAGTGTLILFALIL